MSATALPLRGGARARRISIWAPGLISRSSVQRNTVGFEDVAGPHARGLARHRRDGAHVDADRRQDAARVRADAQPLVAGAAVPHTGKAVTSVAITMPGNNQTVAFTGQKCTVTVRYLSTVITVVTGNNGRGLQVQTNFNSFHAGSTPNHLAHNDASGKISHVTVMKGNQTAFDSNATGGTEVVISYQ